MAPALAFGGASFQLKGNVGAQSGLAEIDITDLEAAGGVMSVDIGITTTAAGCGGFDVSLAASTDDVIMMTGRTVNWTYWRASIADKALFTTYKMLKTSALSIQNLGGTYTYPGYSWSPAQVAHCMTVDLSVGLGEFWAPDLIGFGSHVVETDTLSRVENVIGTAVFKGFGRIRRRVNPSHNRDAVRQKRFCKRFRFPRFFVCL